MVKLPISDYVYQHYREQGTEFTFRQQAHLCWAYNGLLKDRLKSLEDILKISDDKKLNMEIKERLEYEEKIFQHFMANDSPGCIYVVCPDDMGEYDTGYFSSAQNAVLYGKQNCAKEYKIIKRYLFDRCPKEVLKNEEPDKFNTWQAEYMFTSDGEVKYGCAYECPVPFDGEDKSRFENMFLNIRTPFGLGDVVMGGEFDRPGIVNSDYDCFEKIYDWHKNDTEICIDDLDNCICIIYIEKDGKLSYGHVDPFSLWKIDSWDNEEYWKLLEALSKSIRAGINMLEWDYLLHEYQKHHEEKKGWRNQADV